MEAEVGVEEMAEADVEAEVEVEVDVTVEVEVQTDGGRGGSPRCRGRDGGRG